MAKRVEQKREIVNPDQRVIRLRPYNFIHVLNNNTNVARVESGPKTFVRQDHEQIVQSPTAMINIPPRSYCVVGNPCVFQDGNPVMLENGQVKLRHGELEIRSADKWPNPFPLYPGEFLQTEVTTLTVVKPGTALKLLAVRDFVDEGEPRQAGDEWLSVGPGTYYPHIAAKVVETFVAQVIKPNQALRLKAERSFVDRNKIKRRAGEEWLVREQGSYLPDVFEKVIGMVKARVLTEKRALHLHALHTFTDVYGKVRRAGQEWLVTDKDSQIHIPDINEEVVGDVPITTLTKQQYCVVLNPVDKDGNPQWGNRELRRGERIFFLQPGEQLEKGTAQDVIILGEEEALLLRAKQTFVETVVEGKDTKEVRHNPGEEWMIYGPCDYVPPVEIDVENMERRQKIPLDENEGIYVRNKRTGKVYTVSGQTYMLQSHEELWNKTLPEDVENLLAASVDKSKKSGKSSASGKRVLYKMITYRVPHNAAVQIYDYKKKVSRVVFGPDLVMLEPDEQFSIISLSGGDPKKPNAITTLALPLGPDFMNDRVDVETSDHARLRLKLSYNWRFEVDRDSPKKSLIFSVRDFVGDTCKAIASRVRGAVAAQSFDDFHKNSAQIIKAAVFGMDKNGVDVGTKLLFNANLLAVTNVDIQSVEPVEQRTRDALQKSVQLAIEISTNSQEALASHEAMREEQIAEGKLLRQKIKDQAQAEFERKSLVELKAQTAAVETTGQAKAEAIARSEASLIKGAAAVKQARLKAEASAIRADAKLKQIVMRQKQELENKKAVDELEIARKQEEARIEAAKFKSIIDAIGSDTIEAIARAGPEMQAKLLEGLGLQGFLVTDGSSPINLFNTASGLINNATVHHAPQEHKSDFD